MPSSTKTHNYEFNLMTPLQTNKEVLFNETICKIDSLTNLTVQDMVDCPPEELDITRKYIVTDGSYQNFILYCPATQQGWQYFMPKEGMIIFLQKTQSFFIFSKDLGWRPINSNRIESKFEGIKDNYNIEGERDYYYLYLNNNCHLNIGALYSHEVKIILKQNVEQVYNVTWSDNIFWLADKKHTMTLKTNSVDLINLYYLPESRNIIGSAIHNVYRF